MKRFLLLLEGLFLALAVGAALMNALALAAGLTAGAGLVAVIDRWQR